MKKKSVEFPVPQDIKVAQKGSVLVTNARPLYSPQRFGMNPGAEPVGPDRDVCNGKREFLWPSHTDGRGRKFDE